LQRERRLAREKQFAGFRYRQDAEVWEMFHSIWPSRSGGKDFEVIGRVFLSDLSSRDRGCHTPTQAGHF
jgi:hypothetical protein